ncbi:hypothetical protein Q1695_010007 [Nippostrongylus brasiliensis]|nr:hypothetical protein Q1695_010007 [Nippostrongylus brasiliensis]
MRPSISRRSVSVALSLSVFLFIHYLDIPVGQIGDSLESKDNTDIEHGPNGGGSRVTHLTTKHLENNHHGHGPKNGSGRAPQLTTKYQPVHSECECVDANGVAHDFCYHLPENGSIQGRRFSCHHTSTLQSLGLLNTSHLPFALNNFSNPAMVTAFSENHQNEAVNLFESIAKYFPEQRVIVYDLGGVERGELKKFDFLEFRLFNFSRYPEYVRQLRQYRWKPIVIAEVLSEFEAIWYMDSSVVFKKGNLRHVYDLIGCRKRVLKRSSLKSITERDQREARTPHENGWNIEQWKENVAECRKAAYLLHGYSGHGIYPATATAVYNFIPTNFVEIKKPKAKMYEAGFAFVARTIDAMENIVKWYVLCALEKDCMAGNHRERIRCYFKKDRYDQSVVNVLAANSYWYDRHYYASEIVDFFDIIRSRSELKLCGTRQAVLTSWWAAGVDLRGGSTLAMLS